MNNHTHSTDRGTRSCVCGYTYPTPEPSAEADAALYSDPVAYRAGWEDGQAVLRRDLSSPATPPLDVERHREAVRRAWTQTHAPTPEAWSDVIAREYAALANPTPEDRP